MGAFGEIAKLLASLDLDTRLFEKGAKNVSGDLSKMEGGLGRVSTRAIAFGSAIGTGIERLAEKGIGALFGAVQAGEEGLNRLNDVQAQTAAVVESTGGKAGVTAQQIRDMAESLESVTTADDKAIQSGENLLLTFTGIGKDVFPAASKAVVDLGIAMAQGDVANADFKSSAIQIGKALNDPIKGITALSRVGVSFTEQQIKQIKALVKSGDVMGAQKVILKELETEFGKAGEAAGKSGAAGVRRLNDAVEDTQISLAEGLAPALEEIRSEIGTALEDPKTQQAAKDLGKFLGDAARNGVQFAKSIPWEQVGEGLKTAAGFAGKLIDVFAHLPPGVQGTLIGLAALNKLGGGGVIKVGVNLLGEGVKGLLGQFVSRGSPANPMFVVAEGAGLGGAGGAVGAAAKGGLGLASKLFLVGEAIGLIAAVNEVRDNIAGELTQQTKGVHDAVSQQINDTKTTAGQLQQSLDGVNQGIEALSHDPIGNALLGDQLSELEKIRSELGTALKNQDDTNKANFRQGERDDKTRNETEQRKLDAQKTATEQARDKIESSRIALSTKLNETRSAVTTGSNQIVDAIDRLKLDPKIIVNVPFRDTGDSGSRPGTQPPSVPFQDKGDVGMRLTAIVTATSAVGDKVRTVATNTALIGDLFDAVGEVGTNVDQAKASIVAAVNGLKSANGTITGPTGLRWKPSDTIQIEDRRGEAGPNTLRDFLRRLGITVPSGDSSSGRVLGDKVLRDGIDNSLLPTLIKDQKTAIDAARDKIEASRIALSTKLGETRNAVSSGANEIVNALDRLTFPTPAVYVTVKDGSVTSSAGFVSGGRTGGGARRP